MFGCELKSCVKVDYSKDYFNDNHTHPYYELVYYYEGSGTVNIMDKPYKFAPQTFSVNMPEHYHNERGTQGTKIIYIGFILNTMKLEDGLYKDENGKIGKIIKECYGELNTRKPLFQFILNNLTERAVLNIIRSELKTEQTDKDNFAYILNYIDMSYNLNLSVKEIAKNIGYSYNYFRELFFRHMNISVKDYVTEKRIENVKALLTSTDYHLSKIASMSGFSSASHLCMAFREKTGITPQQFIKSHEKDDYDIEQHYLNDEEKTAIQ